MLQNNFTYLCIPNILKHIICSIEKVYLENYVAHTQYYIYFIIVKSFSKRTVSTRDLRTPKILLYRNNIRKKLVPLFT